MKFKTLWGTLLFFVGLGLFSVSVLAQTSDQLKDVRDINVLTFYPTGALGNNIVTHDADIEQPWSWDIGLGLWYARGLLKIKGNDVSYDAIKNQIAGSILFRISIPGPDFLYKRLEFGGSFPVALWQTDKGSFQGIEAPKKAAWGDPDLYLKALLFKNSWFSLGLRPFVYLGIGRKHNNSSNGWAGGASMLFGFNPTNRWGISVETGFVYRNALEVTNVRTGKALMWSLATNYTISSVIDIVGDLWGETFIEGVWNKKQVPMELDTGLRFNLLSSSKTVLRFLLGAGTGLGTKGPGNPDVRVFGILQLGHRSPKDLDKDKDGIMDKDDKCPNQPEDKDNFEDNDGCPDPDNDHDGILDKDDRCPNQPEDKDNFEDNDRCPDPDNDHDGILDKDDKCPNQPETVNGNKDEDGCPDKGKSLVKLTNNKIIILQKIYFKFNKAIIKRKSYPVLVQVATILRLHKEIKKVEIQGHTDTLGSAAYNMKLSQRRAEAVRKFLINAGVEPKRLVAVGYGETLPVVDCSHVHSKRKRRACEAKNRRVEFVILEQN